MSGGNLLVPNNMAWNLGDAPFVEGKTTTNNNRLVLGSNGPIDEFLSINTDKWTKTAAGSYPTLASPNLARFKMTGAGAGIGSLNYPSSDGSSFFDINDFEYIVKVQDAPDYIKTYCDANNTECVLRWRIYLTHPNNGDATTNYFAIRMVDYHYQASLRWRLFPVFMKDDSASAPASYWPTKDIKPTYPRWFKMTRVGDRITIYDSIAGPDSGYTQRFTTTNPAWESGKIWFNFDWANFITHTSGAFPTCDIDYSRAPNESGLFGTGKYRSPKLKQGNGLFNWALIDVDESGGTITAGHRQTDNEPDGPKDGTVTTNNGDSVDWWNQSATHDTGSFEEGKPKVGKTHKSGVYSEFEIELTSKDGGVSTPSVGGYILNYGGRMKTVESDGTPTIFSRNPDFGDYKEKDEGLLSEGETSSGNTKLIASELNPIGVIFGWPNATKTIRDQMKAIQDRNRSKTLSREGRKIKFYPNESINPTTYYEGFWFVGWRESKKKAGRYDLEYGIKERL